MKLNSRGKKESVPLMLYLPKKQSVFLCPPGRIEQTMNTRKKQKKAGKTSTPGPAAIPPYRYRQPLRRTKEQELPEWLDELDDESAQEPDYEAEDVPEAELITASVPSLMQPPAAVPVPHQAASASNPMQAPAAMKGNQIFVSLLDEGQILVIDGETDTAADTITLPFAGSAKGIALNPVTNRIYAIDSARPKLTVLDGSTKEVIAVVPVSPFPSLMAVNVKTNRLYITNALLNTVDVLDGEANRLIESVIVGKIPAGIAINEDTNRIYVANGSPDHTISIIDGCTNTRLLPDIPVGHEPGLAGIHAEANLIYVPNIKNDSVTVIDGATNKVIKTITEGIGKSPYAAGFDTFANLVYVSNSGSDNVSVIDASSHKVVETIPVGACPKAVAVNTRTNRIYVAVSDGVAVIDGEMFQVVKRIELASSPGDLVLYE